MDARRGVSFTPKKFQMDCRGQGVVEFLFVLPVILLMSMFLVRTNTVIQMSIVNQKYARAQNLFLTYNSAEYPDLVRRAAQPNLEHQTVLVASNEAPREGAGGDGRVFYAATFKIKPGKGGYFESFKEDGTANSVERGIAGRAEGEDAEGQRDIVRERSFVRVRNTVTLCMPLNTTLNPSQNMPANISYCRGGPK
jgi:hypothetical protein